MKKSIQWHEDCLRNRKISLDQDRTSLDLATERLDNSVISYNNYLHQITQAKDENKDGFDRDRYLVKK